MAAYEREPAGGGDLIAGISADQVSELLELIDRFGGMRPMAVGDSLRSWDIRRCVEIFRLVDCPVTIAKITTGVDSMMRYRDVYHFEGEGWCYQLRHHPDIRYPEGLDRSHLHERPSKWAFDGDEKSFVRDLVQAKLMMV